MPENKHLNFILRLFYAGLAAAASWLFVTRLLPCLLPFLAALAVARLIEPLVAFLVSRARIPRAAASAICSVLALGLLFGLMFLITFRTANELSSLALQLPGRMANLAGVAESIERKINGFIIAAPIKMQDFLYGIVDNIVAQSMNLPALIYNRLVGILSDFAGCLPGIMLFTITAALAAYFISSQYAALSSFVMRQIPEKWRDRVFRTKDHLIRTMGKWLVSQLMLMAVTFVELVIGFLIIGVEYPILLAGAIAIIDFLPIFGTGTVFIPWAIISLLGGDYSMAAKLAVFYAVVTVVRNFLQPKLIGDQIGLSPLATLVAIYAGFCLFGLWGMLLFPILLITLKQLQDWDYIRLWK